MALSYFVVESPTYGPRRATWAYFVSPYVFSSVAALIALLWC